MKRSLAERDCGRGNIRPEPSCFSRMAFADLTLSRASFIVLSASNCSFWGLVGFSRALAERARLSLLGGGCRLASSELMTDTRRLVSIPRGYPEPRTAQVVSCPLVQTKWRKNAKRRDVTNGGRLVNLGWAGVA